MNYLEFNEKCGSESNCINLFIKIYYYNGLYCAFCKRNEQLSVRNNTFKMFQCNHCNKSFSIFNNTPFYNTHIDFRKWLYIFHSLTGSSTHKYSSHNQLSNEINATRKTIWRMTSQLKKIFKDQEAKKLIGVLLEINDKILNGYLINPVISE